MIETEETSPVGERERAIVDWLDGSPIQLNRQIYLAPDFLTANEANEKARPNESPEARKARVAEMAASIWANGQEYPVLVVELPRETGQAEDGWETCYEYIDGGCRVEAIALLNAQMAAAEKLAVNPVPLKVWCSIVPSGDDLFRRAVVANLHRTQNSLMDMAYIVRETIERNGWKGKGTGAKVALYLGIAPSRVSEYAKLLKAPKEIRERIDSGEIATVDAALKIMAVPPEQRAAVAERAQEIAQEEQAVVEEAAGKAADAKAGRPEPLPVKARHVQKAARETGAGKPPRNKGDIIEFFSAVTAAAYPKAAAEFARYFVEEWMPGAGSDKGAYGRFDAAVGVKAAAGVKAAEVPAKKKPVKAVKAAKAVRKGKK